MAYINSIQVASTVYRSTLNCVSFYFKSTTSTFTGTLQLASYSVAYIFCTTGHNGGSTSTRSISLTSISGPTSHQVVGGSDIMYDSAFICTCTSNPEGSSITLQLTVTPGITGATGCVKGFCLYIYNLLLLSAILGGARNEC